MDRVELREVRYFTGKDFITVFWRKPEYETGTYDFFLNGKYLSSADTTYYTFQDLEPETEYSVTIRCSHAETKLICRTRAVHRCIDVSKAPYYAVGDGKTMNTQVLQRAIDDCGVHDIIFIPKGIFLTGALRLHSDMELYLEEGAVLQGTDCPEDYLPKVWSRFEGIERECYSSLLNLGNLDHTDGYNCENVMIRGKGTIASGGRSLAEKVIVSERERLREYLTSLGDEISEYEKPETIPGRVRPRLISINNSRNIVLSGVTFREGACWNVHMVYSDNVVTEGCTFYSRGVWNGDGWDPDSSTNCAIFNCVFHTGDDSISIKSGKNPEGNLLARPAEHIWIFHCRCVSGNGITIGSEMSGGVEDVDIWDCDMSSSYCGIEIKGTQKRGGYVRNIHMRDSTVARVSFHSVSYNDDGAGAPVLPVFENCCFERLCIKGEYLNHEEEWEECDAIVLAGFDVQDYELRNITFTDIIIGNGRKKRSQSILLQLCDTITLERIKTV